MQVLKNKKILLGITGSIAAFRSLELIRRLKTLGAEIIPILTPNAKNFVTELTVNTLSAPQKDYGQIEHIELAYAADVALIAPATANTIAKMAHGMADNLLLETLLSVRAPILLAPAMESRMWQHPATQDNILTLKNRGAKIVEPQEGALASGREGIGRMASKESIEFELCKALWQQDFAHKKVLVTAGPTFEDLDPVRFISNRSSGKMGTALAHAFAMRGAQVELICTESIADQFMPSGVNCHKVRSANQMHDAALSLAPKANIACCVAAVCDHRPSGYSEEKLKKGVCGVEALQLLQNPDTLADIGRLEKKPFLIGFAAESENLIGNAIEKCARKNCDLLCANDISKAHQGFQSNENAITIVNAKNTLKAFQKTSKENLAHQILDLVSEFTKQVSSKNEKCRKK